LEAKVYYLYIVTNPTKTVLYVGEPMICTVVLRNIVRTVDPRKLLREGTIVTNWFTVKAMGQRTMLLVVKNRSKSGVELRKID